jgi:hypothetical protein
MPRDSRPYFAVQAPLIVLPSEWIGLLNVAGLGGACVISERLCPPRSLSDFVPRLVTYLPNTTSKSGVMNDKGGSLHVSPGFV